LQVRRFAGAQVRGWSGLTTAAPSIHSGRLEHPTCDPATLRTCDPAGVASGEEVRDLYDTIGHTTVSKDAFETLEAIEAGRRVWQQLLSDETPERPAKTREASQ
jgi:hypothetical protein